MEEGLSAANQDQTTAARASAEQWLGRFAPLLQPEALPTREELRANLKTVQALQEESDRVVTNLSVWAAGGEPLLLTTLREAIAQLPGLEQSYRQRLGLSAPPVRSGIDLQDLRAKLAEAAARSEMGASVLAIPERIELRLTGGNIAGALVLGLFSLAWNSFTLFHASLMIGGMYHAFGPAAFFLLLFYALFFGAGFAMVKGAIDQASREDVVLEGKTLRIRRTLGFWVREKVIELGPESRVGLDLPTVQAKGSRTLAFVVNDREGKLHQFGVSTPEHLKSGFLQKLNTYLESV